MGIARVLVLLGLAGCSRFGFGPIGPEDGDADSAGGDSDLGLGCTDHLRNDDETDV